MPGSKNDDVVPGLVLDDKLAAKLDGLDDQLMPIKEELKEDETQTAAEEGKEDSAEDPQTQQTDKTEKSEEDGQGSAEDGGQDPSSDDSAGSQDGDQGDGDPDEGYTIDEGDEEPEDQPTTSTEETKTDPESSQLTAEQQYILDGIQPIKVRGTVGDSSEVKEFEVYSPEYLPQGFKFVDDREMAAAAKAFNALEQRAVQLQQDFRTQQTQKAATEFKKREDAADRQDIAELQRAGEIPRFKAEPNSAAFETDPAVVLVQEVLDFKEAQNNKYMEEYNAGRPYKHIGFDEAFRMYQRQNPTKSNPAQTKEDQERSRLAKRTSKSNGSSAKQEVAKPQVHSGMSSMDLDALIESKTAGW